MYNDTFIDKTIDKDLIAQDQLERGNHKSSGKLTASGLGEPLQWQVLKSLRIGDRVVDGYTLRKFLRGRQIEQWLIGSTPGVIKVQEAIEYRGVVGFVDALVDTKNYDFPLGVIPHEVKSVTNAKFKRIKQQGEADIGHKLQAGLYALAVNSEHYAIDYVASDDLRVLNFTYPTAEISSVIDMIISEYDAQIAKQQVPVFAAKQKWQENPVYNKFPEWTKLTQDELDLTIKVHYPDVWQKLKS